MPGRKGLKGNELCATIDCSGDGRANKKDEKGKNRREKRGTDEEGRELMLVTIRELDHRTKGN
jgi:hypothetical protein